MKKLINKFSLLTVAAMVLAATALSFTDTSAHFDPAECSSVGSGISISVFRADGVTPIVGSVQSAETIKYQATLSHLGPPNCNFEGGTLSITTPDATVTVVASGAQIPLVSFGSPYTSPQVSYIVSEGDVVQGNGSIVTASASYVDGVSHFGEENQTVGNSANISTPFVDSSLVVTKTAVPSSGQTYTWTIDKSVSPDTWWLFSGDSGTSMYTVDVTRTLATSTYSVSGLITINNPADFATATIASVADEISGVGAVTVDCGVVFPYDLVAGGSLECSYSSDLPDDASRTNTATVTTSGDVNGGSGEAEIDFTGVNPELVNPEVDVTDTNGQNWHFADSGQVTYDMAFDCANVEYTDYHAMYTHDNTAAITQTGQSDDASVAVHCYELAVSKTATTAFDRDWDWMIDKSADQSQLTLAEGETATVNYDVMVDATSTTANWMVSGDIMIMNPNPNRQADLTAVLDMVSPAMAAAVDCPSLVVGASSTLICTYSLDLPDGSDRTNTATATLQNMDFDADNIGTPGGTVDFSGMADVMFSGDPMTETDECIEVSDTNDGVLGTVCAADAPMTFEYSLTFGDNPDSDVVLICGENTHPNTASFVTNDTAAVGQDSWTVNATLECVLGCTLTQGYWKTHSQEGPAPYDEAWQNLGADQEDTVFYLSGMTWYEVFWTSPRGNAYYNLAHQYMAATLNSLNEAGVPAEVQTALDDAADLFNTYTPAQVGAWRGNQGERQTFISLAGILGSYNEGVIGPGHCEE